MPHSEFKVKGLAVGCGHLSVLSRLKVERKQALSDMPGYLPGCTHDPRGGGHRSYGCHAAANHPMRYSNRARAFWLYLLYFVPLSQ